MKRISVDAIPISYSNKCQADRIRNMSDEELAKFLHAWHCSKMGWCDDCTSIRGDLCNGIEKNGGVSELKFLQMQIEV